MAPPIGACAERTGENRVTSGRVTSGTPRPCWRGSACHGATTDGSEHGWCGTRPQRRGSRSGYPHPAACPVWRAGPPSPGRMQVRLNASCPARWSCLSWLSPGRALRTTPRQNPHGCGRGGLLGLRPVDADAPPCKARPPSRGGPIHGRSLQGRGVGAGIGEFCRYICWRSSGRCSSVLPCR